MSTPVTAQTMCRIVFEIKDTTTWYAVMQEARAMFGKNWRCQGNVRRKLEWGTNKSVQVWFEVPDPQFATWVSLKLAVNHTEPTHK
jgi:hypothetical protein